MLSHYYHNTPQRLIAGISLLCSMTAQAHLMPAQHGTLNFAKDSAYLVLSVPVAVFDSLDDNADGAISMLEFNRHRAELAHHVTSALSLGRSDGHGTIEDLILSPTLAHQASQESIDHVTILGRFTAIDPHATYRFHVDLYASSAPKHALKITAKLAPLGHSQTVTLSPEHPSALLQPGAW